MKPFITCVVGDKPGPLKGKEDKRLSNAKHPLAKCIKASLGKNGKQKGRHRQIANSNHSEKERIAVGWKFC